MIKESLERSAMLRISKYEIIDYLNQMTNTLLSQIPNSDARDNLLQDLKRAKELVNNL